MSNISAFLPTVVWWHKSVSQISYRLGKNQQACFWQWSCTPSPRFPPLSEPIFAETTWKSASQRIKVGGGGCYHSLEGYLHFVWVLSKESLNGISYLSYGPKRLHYNSWQTAKIWPCPSERRPPLFLLTPVGRHRIDKRRHHTFRWLRFNLISWRICCRRPGF